MTPLLLTVISATLISACGDAPTGPAEGAEMRLVLSVPDTIELGRTEQAVVLLASPGGAPRSPGAFTLEVVAESRTHGDLPVMEVGARSLRATGPGTLTVIAVAAGLASEPRTVTVPRAPILTGVQPTRLPAEGGIVTLEGYDLSMLSQVELDGVARATRQDGGDVRIDVPPAPSSCTGRSHLALTAAAAYVPQGGPFTLQRAREGEIALNVGQWVGLGSSPDLCLRLPAARGAEYALAYFDPRGIRSAIGGEESTRFPSEPVDLRVGDRTAPESGGGADGLGQPGAGTDVVPAPAGFDDVPSDHYTLRTTPWAVADSFTVSMNGVHRGRIIHATSTMAIGTLDRDAGRDVAGRVRDLETVLAVVEDFAVPILSQALSADRPVSTPGAGQMLVVIATWEFPGFFGGGGNPMDVNGGFIGLDPGIALLPRESDLFLGDHVLVHEMAHAFQNRYLQARCREEGDCVFSAFSHVWAVEGGAELLSEYILATAYGFGFAGNASLNGRLANAYGPIFWQGTRKHYVFSAGYGSASWLLRDLAHRLVRAGAPVEDAFAQVARGALEGWYGHLIGTGERPGLTRRVQARLGSAWDPREAALLALLSVAADDRTAVPELSVPAVRDMWTRFEPALGITLGSGSTDVATVAGLTFAYYPIVDRDGRGGSVHVFTDGTELDWALVRVR